MILPVNDKFKKIYTTDKRIIIITGGRGSGKSFNTSLFLKRLTYEKGHTILYTRYTMTSAEKSVIPEFNEKIELEEDFKYFDVTSKSITNKASGSQIVFSGIKTSSGNQTANLKGIQGLTTFVVDEAEEWTKEDEYDKIRLSIRTKGVKNRVIIVMNPTDVNHFVFQKYFKDTYEFKEIDGVQVQMSTHPDVEHIHTTYLDNIEHLAPDFLQDVKSIKETNKKKYEEVVIGRWRDKKEGVILPNWTKGEFNNDLPYIFVLDWGSKDPFTLTKMAIDRKHMKIYVKNLVYQSNLSTADIKERVSLYVKDEIIIADSANRTGIHDLREWGFNAYPSYKGTIVGRLTDMQDYQLVLEDSPEVEHELNNYVWLDKKGEYPIDDFNHVIDPLGYGFLYNKRNR